MTSRCRFLSTTCMYKIPCIELKNQHITQKMSTNWVFWVPFISMAMLIVVSESCTVLTNRPIEQELDDNKDSPWMVLITDKPTQQLEDIKGNA